MCGCPCPPWQGLGTPWPHESWLRPSQLGSLCPMQRANLLAHCHQLTRWCGPRWHSQLQGLAERSRSQVRYGPGPSPLLPLLMPVARCDCVRVSSPLQPQFPWSSGTDHPVVRLPQDGDRKARCPWEEGCTLPGLFLAVLCGLEDNRFLLIRKSSSLPLLFFFLSFLFKAALPQVPPV